MIKIEKMNINEIIKDEEVKKNFEDKLRKAKEIYIERIAKLCLKKSSNIAIKKWIEEDKELINKKVNKKLENNLDKIIKERLYKKEYEKNNS